MEEKPIEKQVMSKIMSELGKQSHKKSPRSKEFYQQMAKKRWGKHTCRKHNNMLKSNKEINKDNK